MTAQIIAIPTEYTLLAQIRQIDSFVLAMRDMMHAIYDGDAVGIGEMK